MDEHRMTVWIRALGGFPSRRDLLRGLGAAGLTLGSTQFSADVDAKKKHKGKHKKRRKKVEQLADAPNAFGCIDVGDLCQNDAQCCSGICDGKQGKKTCRAHHTGTCQQGGEGHCVDPDPSRWSCNGTSDCACLRTTAGSDACVADAPSGFDYCSDCVRDSDCEAIGYPEGSVCLPLIEGYCATTCPNQRACFPPCGSEWPIL
jgi:hypothetical protein